MSDNITSSSYPHLPLLPEVLVFEILSRLPSKSLIRSKSVCKRWRDLISTTQFLIKHLLPASDDDRHRLLIKRRDKTTEEPVFSFFPPHSHARPLPFAEIPVVPYDPTFLQREIEVLGPCNGLVCLFDTNTRKGHHVVLWRPADGDMKILTPSGVPDPPGRRRARRMRPFIEEASMFNPQVGFGYDAETEDYKVVIRMGKLEQEDYLHETKIEIYSFKKDSWKGVTDQDDEDDDDDDYDDDKGVDYGKIDDRNDARGDNYLGYGNIDDHYRGWADDFAGYRNDFGDHTFVYGGDDNDADDDDDGGNDNDDDDDNGDDFPLDMSYFSTACLNGMLLWWAGPRKIVWFRMSDELFGTIKVPVDIEDIAFQFDDLGLNIDERIFDDNDAYWEYKLFGLNDENLALVLFDNTTRTHKCFHVWVLFEFGVEESWTRVVTVGPLVGMQRPISFWRNGKIIMENNEGELFVYDLLTNDIESLSICGIPGSLRVISIEDKYISH